MGRVVIGHEEAIETILRLRDLLQAISEEGFLSKSLVLKGGTALNLCFGPPPRLSVDLDFNYVGSEDRGRMSEDRTEIRSRLERVARRGGYRVQFSREEHAGQKLYLRYRSALGGERTLQMDVNYLYRIPLEPIQELPFWNPAKEPTVKTHVVEAGGLRVSRERGRSPLPHQGAAGRRALAGSDGGGEETPVLDVRGAGYWRYWTVQRDGIYVVTATDASRPLVEFFSFVTGKTRELASLEKPIMTTTPGLAVSPDERWLLYTQVDQSGSDLMLLENFR
jgi:hypothetical protein